MALSTPSYEAWLDYPGAGPGVGWGTLTVGGRMFSKLGQRFIGPPPAGTRVGFRNACHSGARMHD